MVFFVIVTLALSILPRGAIRYFANALVSPVNDGNRWDIDHTLSEIMNPLAQIHVLLIQKEVFIKSPDSPVNLGINHESAAAYIVGKKLPLRPDPLLQFRALFLRHPLLLNKFVVNGEKRPK